MKRKRKQFKKKLGNRIWLLRKLNGVSQEQLGKILGLHQAAVSRVEKGTQDLLPYQLATLAQKLNTTVGFIVLGQE